MELVNHQRSFLWNYDLAKWDTRSSLEYLYHSSGFMKTKISWIVDSAGADSAVHRKFFFYQGNQYFTTYDSICYGEDLMWQGQHINSEGTYSADYQSAMGKDSTYTLMLKVHPNPENFVISGDTEVIQGKILASMWLQNTNGISYKWHVENGTISWTGLQYLLVVKWDNTGDATVSGYALI